MKTRVDKALNSNLTVGIIQECLSNRNLRPPKKCLYDTGVYKLIVIWTAFCDKLPVQLDTVEYARAHCLCKLTNQCLSIIKLYFYTTKTVRARRYYCTSSKSQIRKGFVS